MSPGDSGDDQTHSPVVVSLRQSDPVSSVSSGRLRCPESPRCADSSPDRLRRKKKTAGGKCVLKLQVILSFKGFHSHISNSNIFPNIKWFTFIRGGTVGIVCSFLRHQHASNCPLMNE